MHAKLLLDTQSILGEGALWNVAAQELYWIDIENGFFHRYNPVTHQQHTTKVGQKIGTVVPTTIKNHVLVALQDGIYDLNIETEQKTLVCLRPEPTYPMNRFNDGKCDVAGRLWVGTLSMEQLSHVAGLYMVEKGLITQKLDTISISNGIAWSLDTTKLYYIDTPTQVVKEFLYDKNTGSIQFSRIAVKVPKELGYPDGMTIDAEGMLWIALWEGFGVTRWNPTTGELLMKIDVPVSRVTSCAFGGNKLDTLYITTACVDASSEELKQYPYSGGLFAIKTGHVGIPCCVYSFDT